MGIMKSINYQGTDYNEFKNVFLEFLDEKNLFEIWDVIEDCKQDFLTEGEVFEVNCENEGEHSQGYNKLIPKTHYHVNLKNVSIICLQMIEKIMLQNAISGTEIKPEELPIISLIVELKQCLTKLSEENGELCICKEINGMKGDFESLKDLENARKECINNHLKCTFNQNGSCILEKEEFEEIINALIQKRIVAKENGVYKIVL